MSGWGFTKAHVPNYLRGGDEKRHSFKIISPRSPAADILGAAYRFSETPSSPEFRGWLSEFIPDLTLRSKLSFDLKCLNALNSSSCTVDPMGVDLSAEDALTTPLGCYLLSLKEIGFRGRFFDLESQYCLLFRDPVPIIPHIKNYPDGRFSYLTGSPSVVFSFFRAIEIKPDLPLENKYTEATHIAALFNCPLLMAALVDSPADYLRQDASNFYGILDGLTALHHAARALSKKALMRLLEIVGPAAFEAVDKNGNTFLHALACSQNSGEGAAHQIDLLKTFVKFFFATERDLSKREKFYQHINKFGDTALNIAANRGNKELVTELVFLPGAKTEAKSATNPKGLDFGALGIDYGTLLARKHAIFGEYMMTLEESVFSLREEGGLQREAMRAMADALDASERRQALLEDALARSEQNQFLLMQMMQSLCGDLTARGLIGPDLGRLAVPFFALGDRAETQADAGAGAGAEEEKGPDHE